MIFFDLYTGYDKIKKVLKVNKKYDPARIRTWNPLIRSQMPYPLGHRADVTFTFFITVFIFVSWTNYLKRTIPS